jgi:hypothetical protein
VQLAGEGHNSKKFNYKLNNFCIVFGYIFILSLCAVTFAKYTASISENENVSIAKWEVSAGDMDKSFNLFSTSEIYDLPQGVVDINELSDAQKIDEDISPNNNKIVAPGTWGKVNIDITNDSDVAVQYDFSLININTKLPIDVSADGKNWYKLSESDKLPIKSNTLYLSESGSKTETITLYWKWDYVVSDTQDEKDTEYSENGDTCYVTGQVTFTQVEATN